MTREEKRRIKESTKEKFTPPTVQQVADYCKERSNGIDAKAFVDYYETNGWTQGKNGKPIVSWKACVGTWEAKRRAEGQEQREPGGIEI